MQILFNDCGFSDASKRSWLNHYFGTPDIYALTTQQKSEIIDRLKEIKRGLKSALPKEVEEE